MGFKRVFYAVLSVASLRAAQVAFPQCGSHQCGRPWLGRSRLLTGKHIGKCDVQNLKRVDGGGNWLNLRGDWPIRTKTYTQLEVMKKAGYAAAVFGKWEIGSTGAPDKHGVDRFYGYTDQKACHTYYPPYL